MGAAYRRSTLTGALEALMKPILSAFLLCTVIATPAAAQDYYGSPRTPGVYGYNDYDRLVPPLPVPGYSFGTTQSVVTTRRIIGSSLPYVRYGDPDALVTTRHVAAPRPILEEDDVDLGSILPAPWPYRRVVRDATVVAPGFLPAHTIVAPRLTLGAPVVIEERRVETIRRVIRHGGEWLQ
jgi:hypothetical protein